jgi:putative ABC transport system permease protein
MLLLALGNGFYDKSMQNLAFLNNGTIFAWPGSTSKPFAGLPQGQKVYLGIQDFLELMQNIPGVKWYSPVFSSKTLFQFQNKEVDGSLQGIAPGFDVTMQIKKIGKSRFIDPLDINQQNHVVFIDAELKKILFAENEAIGKTLMINQVPFTIIGVADPDDESSINFGDNRSAYIPYTTYLAMLGAQNINTIFLTPQHILDASRIKNNLKNLLAAKLHFDPTDDEAIHMPNLEEQQTFITWFFRIIELFLGFCGGLTLSVGGLGIANMMFLIVTERTREIGLRKAIGASETTILRQFLYETLFLVSVGGVIGALISFAMLSIVPYVHLPDWMGRPHVSFFTGSMTVIILMTVGLLAGYFPAKRAAMMEPVKALTF